MARYDGLAEWYDQTFAWYRTSPAGPGAELRALLGNGPGLVLDVGCGSGLSAAALADAGWTVGGVDESADQLRLAKTRCRWTVRADARHLPFADSTFGCAVLVLVHSDVDDYGTIVRDAARVVKPGGTVIHVGVHPCFVGHHVESVTRSEERLTLVPGYQEATWVLEHENFGPGVRGRIGARHVPLAELLNDFGSSPLRLREAREAGTHLVPWMLSLRFTKDL
jgi:SAM-dependent methyltransferase